MKISKALQKAISTWITAVIVLVVGILCIVAENGDGEGAISAYKSISLVLGITLMVVTGLAVLLKAIVTRRCADSETMANGIIFAVGLFFACAQDTAGNLLYLLCNYVPYALVVVGSLVAVDAILLLVFAFVDKTNKKVAAVSCAVELVIAAVAIVLGVLALPGVDVITAKFTILGIILIVYACYLVLAGVLMLVAGKKPEEKDESIKAEVKEVSAEDAPKAEETKTEEATEVKAE